MFYLPFSAILTAAHCICSHVNWSWEPHNPGRLCVPKGKDMKYPANQIGVDRTIYFIVGHKSLDPNLVKSDISKDSLRPLKRVHRAYILETGKNEKGQVTLNTGMDIGMLIVPTLQHTSDIQTISLPSSLLRSV